MGAFLLVYFLSKLALLTCTRPQSSLLVYAYFAAFGYRFGFRTVAWRTRDSVWLWHGRILPTPPFTPIWWAMLQPRVACPIHSNLTFLYLTTLHSAVWLQVQPLLLGVHSPILCARWTAFGCFRIHTRVLSYCAPSDTHHCTPARVMGLVLGEAHALALPVTLPVNQTGSHIGPITQTSRVHPRPGLRPSSRSRQQSSANQLQCLWTRGRKCH